MGFRLGRPRLGFGDDPFDSQGEMGLKSGWTMTTLGPRVWVRVRARWECFNEPLRRTKRGFVRLGLHRRGFSSIKRRASGIISYKIANQEDSPRNACATRSLR